MKKMFGLCALTAALTAICGWSQPPAQLRFCITADPKTLDPLQVEDDASDTVRYLTGGVLVRMNRQSQQLEPALATRWKVSPDSRTIEFTLRPGVRFSDGTPFDAADVVYTVNRLMDPALHSSTGDAFRSGEGKVEAKQIGPLNVLVRFPAPVVGLDREFDQVVMMSSRSPHKERAVLGPYRIAERKAGSYLLLTRNPNYWRRDEKGRQLPYIDSIRLDIQQNREIEVLRLMRGEIDLINTINPEYYDKLAARSPAMAVDAGPSLDSEQLWFNQSPGAPLPEYKKAWFRSTAFRRAISESINRQDLARVVYRGHAQPAVGWISPANRFWFNQKLAPHPFDQRSALARLEREGFALKGKTLFDREGHAVEFSVVTNAGNKARERMAAMIQQDLAGIGVMLNLVTLDFPSLIERITRSLNYEACLLGFVNDELDPNAQMNVWLSSGENHQWNPGQKAPATAWEAEIDRLMRAQASTADPAKRKQAVDRVQQIAWEQEPFLYLVNKNALAAVSSTLGNVHPVAIRPQVFWNVDRLTLAKSLSASK